MEQFNLPEYLKNTKRKVVTRDGRDVRIVCTDVRRRVSGYSYPVCAIIPSGIGNEFEEYSSLFSNKGENFIGKECIDDLFFAPEKPEKYEGWVNLYRDTSGNVYPCSGDGVHDTEDEAKKLVSPFSKHPYIATVKIEWEE